MKEPKYNNPKFKIGDRAYCLYIVYDPHLLVDTYAILECTIVELFDMSGYADKWPQVYMIELENHSYDNKNEAFLFLDKQEIFDEIVEIINRIAGLSQDERV